MPDDALFEPGLLRHRVTIEAPPVSQDAFGQPETTTAPWTAVRTTWAGIEAIGQADRGGHPREVQGDGATTSEVTHAITVRWSPVALRAGMRVRYAAHRYRVQAILNIGQNNVLLKLYCLELNGVE